MAHFTPGPLVSVVIPVYNGADLLPRAVASLRSQTFPRWEAIIADDGSTDQSATVADALAAEEPRLRVVRLPVNRGPSAARNAALAEVCGEWVAYLDHDDEFFPDYLVHLDRHRDAGDVLVFRYDLTEDRPGRPDTGRTWTYDPAAHYEKLPTQHVAVPLGFAHRRELVARLGGFDERLRRDEDAEFIQRYARRRATFTFVPERSGMYHVRGDSQSRTIPRSSLPPVTRPRPPAVLPPRPPGGPRVLFASYHRFGDTSSGASLCTRDLFDLLTPRGWSCGAFTGPFRDAPARKRPPGPCESAARGWHGQLTFTVTTSTAGGYPVSVFEPDPPDDRRRPSDAEAAAFAHLLGEAARAFRPDVVLTYGGDSASRVVPRVAKEVGSKVVFWLHNRAYTSAECFVGCDAVVVPCESSREHYRATLGVETVALPGPWNWERTRCDASDGRHVTFVNPEPAKGVFWFARVAEVLGRTRPDIPLLVVEGRGSAGWLAECGVDLRGVQSLQRMANTTDPRRFYRLSRLVLLPSLVDEGLPRVAVEAMANGIPVIGSGRGGLGEALQDGGLRIDIPATYTPDSRVPPSAAEVCEWLQAVVRLWDDPTAYAEASEAARAAATQHWHPDVLAPRWVEFLTNCQKNVA
jgi:glycosyltransferase involved in cell wall biosynthesis